MNHKKTNKSVDACNNSQYILNPKTGRMVLKTGAIGKKLVTQQSAIVKVNNAKVKVSSTNAEVEQTREFLTGLEDADTTILTSINCLQTLVSIFNVNKAALNLLSQPRVFQNLAKNYNFYYFTNFTEVVLFAKEIPKSQHKIKKFYGTKIENFEIGDRVALYGMNEKYPELNMVVTASKGCQIQLSAVDLIGNKIAGFDETGYLVVRKTPPHCTIWQTTRNDITNDKITKIIKYGISLSDDGPLIKNLDDIYMKYQTVGDEHTLNSLVLICADHPGLQFDTFYVIKEIYSDSVLLHYVDDERFSSRHPSDLIIKKEIDTAGNYGWYTDLGIQIYINFGDWLDKKRRYW